MSKSTNGELTHNRIHQPNIVDSPKNNLLGLTPEDVCSLDFTNIDMEILELSMLEEAYRTKYPKNTITNARTR